MVLANWVSGATIFSLYSCYGCRVMTSFANYNTTCIIIVHGCTIICNFPISVITSFKNSILTYWSVHCFTTLFFRMHLNSSAVIVRYSLIDVCTLTCVHAVMWSSAHRYNVASAVNVVHLNLILSIIKAVLWLIFCNCLWPDVYL